MRDHEFEKELREHETLMKQDQENAVKLAEANTKSALQEDVAKKDAEISEFKAKIEAAGTTKTLEITGAVAKSSEDNLRLANKKAEDLTIKRLTRGLCFMHNEYSQKLLKRF